MYLYNITLYLPEETVLNVSSPHNKQMALTAIHIYQKKNSVNLLGFQRNKYPKMASKVLKKKQIWNQTQNTKNRF